MRLKATFLTAKRSNGIEVFMRKQRKLTTPQEREDRRAREARIRKDGAEADEIATDRMIRRSIEEFGP